MLKAMGLHILMPVKRWLNLYSTNREWFEVKHVIDINNGIATCSINGKFMYGHLFIKIF